MDKKELLVDEWITKAGHDLGMAELAIANKPEYKDLICFHCQQSAEKYLKAYLIRLNMDFKKSHSLIYLLDLLKAQENVPDSIYGTAEILEDYGVEVRYPGNGIELDQEDIHEAYQAALRIKEFVKEKMA
ncbi:HEPN domain-containing protein [Hydrogenispora ethanolica]|jgi:HEPN domain-containing protein|uniref:HEPN domain-containing protein n=1 Tax=Hydrogenispora ethanolica TaxID=1082276 RepID=A0A4R1R9D4_HYDET|nr:HEPN domain-containing protein [Hydrogenispora ethanolica]TCL62323.1 HEPN domain-containing protein [Hydrogenispora ethanolica]